MNLKIKNRHRLKKKEVNSIINKIKNDFNSNFFDLKSIVETGFYKNTQFIFIDFKPYFMFYSDRIIFTLSGLYNYKLKSKYVVVDMGAVKFVVKGADVMIPGIVDSDKNIKPNDMVWICDEKNKKPLALGIALISGEDMINKEKGKAVTILHYVGDNLWDFINSEF